MVPYDTTIKDRDGRIIYEADGAGNPVIEYGRKKPKKEKKAQFQIGYKGYIQLALRSGEYRKLNVLPIKKGELNRPFDALNEGIDVTLIDDEQERANAETIGYYAMFELHSGFRKALYWSYNRMLTHADTYSKAFKKDVYGKIKIGQVPEKDMWKYSSFWYKEFDDMACKTMLRQLISKWGPMSVKRDSQIITALEKDMSVINEDGTHEYIESSDNEPMIIEQAEPEIISDQVLDSGTVDDLPFDVDVEAGEVSMDDL